MEVKTITDIFAATCEIDRAAAMRYRDNGKWIDITVAEFGDRVRWFSTGLRALGVKAGDRLAILSENRPEWAISDFAILCAAGVSVPVYPTLLSWQIEYILNDAGCVAALASTHEQLSKLLDIRSHCPGLRNIIVFDVPGELPEGVTTFAEVLELGKREEKEHSRAKFDDLRKLAKPEDLATIIYTSGTTGNPKGAMLTHRNIATNVVATMDVLPLERGWIAVSFLPLSHSFERTVDYSYFYRGVIITYVDDALKIGQYLPEIKPQVFAAAPRVFEKVRARILDNVATQPASKQKIFKWALKVADQRVPYLIDRKPLPLALKVKSRLADKLVFGKILERLGGRVRFLVSGAAPLSQDLAAFFVGAGLDILEGYGLTETSPVITVNRPDKRRLGTVGVPIPGVEVRIAADGEILARGPNIMKGYFNNPEATAEAIDREGWFHTGDIGEIDADGFLKITDRKKDIIINAYGKNIAPQPLEALLKSSPYVATPVLLGDRRKYLSALIAPNFDRLENEAKTMGVKFDSHEQLVADPRIRQLFQSEIDRFNRNLDRQEKIRRFTLLPRDFTQEEDEMTPTMKVKRKNIDKKYKVLIDAMYSDENAYDDERPRA
jgi:long-chain acyl-CoA synthetase